MNGNKGISLTTALNILLAFCMIRFGLTFTVTMSIFQVTLVVLVGMVLVVLSVVLSKEYAGQLLQSNLLWLTCNIMCVFCLQMLISKSVYATYTSGYINQLIVLTILWGFYLYMKRLSRHDRNCLQIVYLVAVTVSAIYTFYVALNGHSRIIRNTAFGEYDPQFSLRYGGFDFIYGLVVVYVGMLVVWVKGKDRISQAKKILMILLMALFALTIVISGFSTAFALILLATIFIVPKTLKTKLALIGLLGFVVYVIPEVLVNFIKSVPYMPRITSDRLSDLILSFSGQGSAEYITDDGERMDRILWSLEAFKAHPVLGLCASGGNEPLGYHTEWIDQLARYGIITATCHTLFWSHTYQRMKISAKQGTITNKCIRSSFAVFFLLGFLNPISMVVTSAPLFILCPFLEDLFIRS